MFVFLKYWDNNIVCDTQFNRYMNNVLTIIVQVLREKQLNHMTTITIALLKNNTKKAEIMK